MYVLVDEWAYVQTFNAYVVPNVYDIKPFYVTDINVGQSMDLPLYITNPSSTDTLIIQEIYSTEEDVRLKWPHSPEANSQQGEDSVVKFILVPEGSRKLIAYMVFEMNRTLDFCVQIHVKTSLGDVIRIPLYYHVHNDVMKFTPSIVDFGLAPLNFDVLKVPLHVKSRGNE